MLLFLERIININFNHVPISNLCRILTIENGNLKKLCRQKKLNIDTKTFWDTSKGIPNHETNLYLDYK